MGCHTWDPSKSHGHIFAGPTWAATPGAQKDAHMKPSWVPQALADWGSIGAFLRFNVSGLMQENLIWLGFCIKYLSGLVRTVIKVGQVNRLVSTGCL